MDEAYKDKIGERLTLRLADALEKHEVTVDQASEISTYILDNIDKAQSNLELVNFLTELSSKWSIFGNTAVIEQGEVKEQKEEAAIGQASQLIKEDKIDEAIAAVENATAPAASAPASPTDTSNQGGSV